MLKKYYSDKFIVLNMRKHIASLIKGEGLTATEKQQLMLIENLSQLEEYCKTILN